MKKYNFPLYHGTRCKSLDSILKYGLLVPEEGDVGVHSESLQVEEKDPDMTEKRAFRRGVSLTETLEGALTYAFDASKDCSPELLDEIDADFDNACVVQIDCLGKGAKIGSDGYGDLMTNKDIPIGCLKPLRRKDIEKAIDNNLEDYYWDPL